jgi:hypothetical protein
MLFNPASNLLRNGIDPGLVLHTIAGDAAVGQVCSDPETFADVTTLVAADGPAAPPVDARMLALLRMAWPGTAAHARLLWGGRVSARLRRPAPAADEPLPGDGGVPARPAPEPAADEPLPWGDRLPARPGPGPAADEPLPWDGGVPARSRRPGPEPAGELLPALVEDIIGVPATILRRVAAQVRSADRSGTDPVAHAAAPMARLQVATAELVRDRAATAADPPDTDEPAALTPGSGEPATVLDGLLSWRGLGHDRVSLDEVAALVSALTAAVWDAAHAALPRLLDAAAAVARADRAAWTGLATDPAQRAELVDTAVRGGPEVLGWLRVTTQTVLLDGAPIPAGTRCLLLLDATTPRDRADRADRDDRADPSDWGGRPALHALRWLAPESPDGAGATFARLVGDALLAAALAAPAAASRNEPDSAAPRNEPGHETARTESERMAPRNEPSHAPARTEPERTAARSEAQRVATRGEPERTAARKPAREEPLRKAA